MRFHKVERPEARPGVCLVCQGIEGPLVDTLIERPPQGRVYLCQRCVGTATITMGGLNQEQAEQLRGLLEEAAETITELRASLELERESKVVPLADVREMLERERAAARAELLLEANRS